MSTKSTGMTLGFWSTPAWPLLLLQPPRGYGWFGGALGHPLDRRLGGARPEDAGTGGNASVVTRISRSLRPLEG